MPTIQNLQDIKNKIISTIQNRGPSLPNYISREISIQPLFISAYLAEMVSNKELKISKMKVGSSPIYYLQGQEEQLENFAEHLNSKEKEAFHLLKESEVLEDQKQVPAIRVALRSIKDFAVPIQARTDGETKLFWKHFLVTQEETKNHIQNIISHKSKSPQPTVNKLEDNIPQQKTITEQITLPSPKTNPKKENDSLNILEKPRPQKIPDKINSISEFSNNLNKYLTNNEFKILDIVSEKKKEFTAKVQHSDVLFGNQSFYLIAKDKKKITENDLVLALQKSQSEKMPAFLLSPGELDKKAVAYLEEYKNLIKYQKM